MRMFPMAAWRRLAGVAVCACSLLAQPSAVPHAQITDANITYRSGQNIVPIFEGWERVADGSFLMVFGYLNRNYEETPLVPVGANNRFEPADPDRGQPTFFQPRRQRIVFKVPVPKDWGEKELVWSLTVHGRAEQARAHLQPDWELDAAFYQNNARAAGDLGGAINQAPLITGPGPQTVVAGQPLQLSVKVTDDGLPPAPPPSPTPSRTPGRATSRLRVSWIQYRGGPDKVPVTPAVSPVVQDSATATLSFGRPGTYVVRAYAEDGIVTTPFDIPVTVTPAPNASAR